MKKFVAALLASTCIAGTAYAQEVPFSFHPGAAGDSIVQNDPPTLRGFCDASLETLIGTGTEYVKTYNGADFFRGSSCVHKSLLPNSFGPVDHFSIWLWKTTTTPGFYTANNYLVDCNQLTTRRVFTGSGTSSAEINASTVPVAGPVAHFTNIQPITAFAYTMCVGFGTLQ